MKATVIIPLIILLLTISSTISAQQAEKEYTYQVKIANSKGKPQPDIYAYYETTDNEREYFKSDSNGIMTINSNNHYVEMNIDPEKSKGYHRTFFSLYYRKPKADVVYDTKKEIEKVLKGKVFKICHEMPEFPGGIQECLKFIKEKIDATRTPYDYCCGGVQGRVIIQFIVDKKGNITFPVVLRGIDPVLDKYALEIIQSMPKWKPGKDKKGKTVNVMFTIPVMFRLQ